MIPKSLPFPDPHSPDARIAKPGPWDASTEMRQAQARSAGKPAQPHRFAVPNAVPYCLATQPNRPVTYCSVSGSAGVWKIV